MRFNKKTAVCAAAIDAEPTLRQKLFALAAAMAIAAACAASASNAWASQTENAPLTDADTPRLTDNPLFASKLENFRRAIISGDLSGVERALAAGLTPNFMMAGGDTAFTYALRTDHPELAAAMLESGALNVNSPNKYGETPLMMAVFKGQKAIFEKLIERGADVNGGSSWTALHYAATEGRADFVERLLALGAKPNAQTKAGVTPLIMAARKPSREVVMQLLRAGAYRDYCTDKGLSPADFAAKAGDEALGKYLAVEACAIKGRKIDAPAPTIR